MIFVVFSHDLNNAIKQNWSFTAKTCKVGWTNTDKLLTKRLTLTSVLTRNRKTLNWRSLYTPQKLTSWTLTVRRANAAERVLKLIGNTLTVIQTRIWIANLIESLLKKLASLSLKVCRANASECIKFLSTYTAVKTCIWIA